MKNKTRLLWRIYPSYLLITVACMVAASGYTSSVWKSFFLESTSRDLEIRSRLLSPYIEPLLNPVDVQAVDNLCKKQLGNINTRLTIILPNGTVIGDTEENPSIMDNHLDRQEVKAAFLKGMGESIRYSRTLDQDMMYVAVPLKKDGRILAIIRTSVPLTAVKSALYRVRMKVALGAVVLAFLAAGVSLWISKRISRPMEQMRKGAERFAQGDFGFQLVEPPIKEMACLARALNKTAIELKEHIDQITKQSNDYQNVLSSMREGLIAVNRDQIVLHLNPAAEKMFGTSQEDSPGRILQEIIRNQKLNELVLWTLKTGQPQEGDILFADQQERLINVHTTLLTDEEDLTNGALVVFNDVTHLRRLENLRKDFAASVSHEIKTPLTAVKASVETLLSGAMDDAAQARRFLSMIKNNTDRLEAIVEDLLQLARIEKEKDIGEDQLEKVGVLDMIESAKEAVSEKARIKDISIQVRGEENLTVHVNPRLMEQAFLNLLDNAIQYAEPGTSVNIDLEKLDSLVLIHFKDQGPGIAKEHLPRLFERFYRVDKARSRKLGGTGLGLAIVKHIVGAHGGRVTVESTMRQGSLFTIHLPA